MILAIDGVIGSRPPRAKRRRSAFPCFERGTDNMRVEFNAPLLDFPLTSLLSRQTVFRLLGSDLTSSAHVMRHAECRSNLSVCSVCTRGLSSLILGEAEPDATVGATSSQESRALSAWWRTALPTVPVQDVGMAGWVQLVRCVQGCDLDGFSVIWQRNKAAIRATDGDRS